jgi:hypothetical protein
MRLQFESAAPLDDSRLPLLPSQMLRQGRTTVVHPNCWQPAKVTVQPLS